MFILPFFVLMILLSVVTVIEVFLVEYDQLGASCAGMFFSLAAGFFFIHDVQAWVKAIGWSTLLLKDVPIYIALGVGVAFLKWLQFNVRFSNALSVVKASMGKNFNPSSTEDLKKLAEKIRHESFDNPILRRGGGNSFYPESDVSSIQEIADAIAPRAIKNVGRISAWTFTWPFVIANFLLVDVIKKFGKWVAYVFDFLFSGITKRIVHNGLK